LGFWTQAEKTKIGMKMEQTHWKGSGGSRKSHQLFS